MKAEFSASITCFSGFPEVHPQGLPKWSLVTFMALWGQLFLQASWSGASGGRAKRNTKQLAGRRQRLPSKDLVSNEHQCP